LFSTILALATSIVWAQFAMNASKEACSAASSARVSSIPYNRDDLTSLNLPLSLPSISELTKSVNLIKAVMVGPYLVFFILSSSFLNVFLALVI